MASTFVDLNADLGEGFGPWKMGDDAGLLRVVTTANIACGAHAGDPNIMRQTVAEAARNGVAIGAHPGFADLAGFGRRRMTLTAAEMENLIAYQVGALAGIAALEGVPMTHVKTHGALGNICAEDDALAMAVGRGIKAVDPALRYMVMPGQATERAAEKLGLTPISEIYADRTYADNFNLSDRRQPGAVRHDTAEIMSAVKAMLSEGALIAESGRRLPTAIDSICVHGDTPGALTIAKALRAALEEAGFRVCAQYLNG
ncbi:LamB/YcsF family protein [Tropicimonas isoalkanivorans]|uniref:5-oxoprolinase subunit A n=1 Tax=Tropicimonas isoalkanivorans TaxID=441112 RepID=A0A1I1HPB1_9RHOB|nr:5-oxoprolinase subunit PxpA [Tropicimonas isoalkanivorans]SFC25676.1 UPF0271 protein [Tropicimonas isoalkanivorans]